MTGPAGGRLDGFHVEQLIACGGTAGVYRAVHLATDGDVALKVWHAGHGRDARSRFVRECRIHWQLSDHPSVVRLHTAADPYAPRLWAALELCDGSLSERLAGGPMPDPSARQVCLGVIEAARAVAAHGFVHRDINPGNILLRGDDALLADFGSADHATRPGLDPGEGTGPFLAPELLDGGLPGPASELYSTARVLGVTLRPDVPEPLRAALAVATYPDPRRRTTSLSELHHLLDAWQPD